MYPSQVQRHFLFTTLLHYDGCMAYTLSRPANGGGGFCLHACTLTAFDVVAFYRILLICFAQNVFGMTQDIIQEVKDSCLASLQYSGMRVS
jgi:hypothetical protein